MSDPLHHECGVAAIRLLKPLAYFADKYGSPDWAFNKLFLLMEKQHNRGQDGAGIGCIKLGMPLGEPYVFRARDATSSALANIFSTQQRSLRHMRERRKVLVISEDQARELTQGRGRALGRHVRADGLAWLVVGIYKGDGMHQANEAFAPYTTVRAIYGSGDRVGNIEFTFGGLETEGQNRAFEADYRAKLNLNHRAAPSDGSTVRLWNRFMDNIQMARGIAILRTALWVVGLLTLLSGVVGVSNIMLITVRERTREFGIRKAIGAKPWAILRLIIIESVVITTVFGYVGMLCGIAANEYMNATIGRTEVDTGLFRATMFVNPTVGIDVCIEATLVMVLAGTLAGLVPASRAARVRPIEALKEN